MKCKMCNKEFEQLRVNQKFCCKKCRQQYYSIRTKDNPIDDTQNTFNCAYCGQLLTTKEPDSLDPLLKFCCRKCEQLYWRYGKSRKKIIDKFLEDNT